MKYLTVSFVCLVFGVASLAIKAHDANVWFAASLILSSLAREKHS